MDVKQTKQGYVKTFFNDKGYGFIRSTDKDETDYFVRRESVLSDIELKPGQEVKFLPQDTEKGPIALAVTVTKDIPVIDVPQPEMSEFRTGYVKFFDDEKGFGFITSTDSEEETDYFVHYANIASDGHKTLKAAQEVKFIPLETAKGLLALNIIVTKDVPDTEEM